MIISRFPMGGSADTFASGTIGYSASASVRSLTVTGLKFKPRLVAIKWNNGGSSSYYWSAFIAFNEDGTVLISDKRGYSSTGNLYSSASATDSSFTVPELFNTVGQDYSYGGTAYWYAS